MAGLQGYNWPIPALSISRLTRLQLAEMIETRLYPRFVAARLAEALADTPVVLIHGPRRWCWPPRVPIRSAS